MIKLRTILLWAIALLMISTVTIFDPQDITENVLSKLVPERKTQQDTNVTVRLKLDKPVLPGQTAVDVKDVKDAAGNPVPVRTKAAIKSDDTTAPRIVSVVAMSRPGGKDLVLVCFEKRVLPEDAAVAANYDLECPAGSKVFGPKVKYDTESFASTLELGLGRLKVGAKWALRAKNIRDIAGNRISEDAVVEGVVQEYQPLPEVLLAIQDTALAPSGRMVEVVFNGKLDAATAKDAGNYKTSDGRLPETCELLPGGRTVVLTFEQPVTPGETQLHIRSLRDTRGNLLPHIPAQSIVAVEADEPRIVKAAAEAVAGATNDTVAVTFSEPMTPQDAATLGNFTIEASYEPLKGLSPEEQLAVAASALPLAAVPGPVGHIAPLTSFLLSPKATALDLADSKVAYDATTRTTTITLNKPNLRPDATFKVAVSNVRDVSGNAMAAKSVAQGIVGGDKSEPTVAKVLQNIYEDSTGATVDIKFSEAVTASSVEVLGNYVAAGGPTTGGRASAALIAKQQKDKETVRVVFDRPVIPGETAIHVGTATDLAGNTMPSASGVKIAAYEQTPPTVVRGRASAVAGMNNDTISIGFGEAVIPEDAVALVNYELRGPAGEKLDLGGASVAYDMPSQTAIFTLRNRGTKPVNLAKGATYRMLVSNVRDLGGNRIAGKSSVEVTVEGDGAPPSVVSAARNLLLDSTGATVDLTFNEAVDPEAVGDLSNYQIKGKRQLKKVALLGDGRVARLTFDAPVGKAPPTKALVALAVLALLASLLASWLLGISSRAAAMTVRLVFLLIAVALIVVVATGAAGTGVRVFHVRDLAGNERAVAVAPLIETLEPAAPRLASAKAAISADGSRKSFSVAFDKSVDPAAATDAKNFTLECPVGSAIDLKGAKMEYDPETFTATVDLSSRAADVKGLKLGDEFRIAVANVRDVHGNAIAANSHVSGKIGGDFNPPKPLQAFQDLELDLVQLKEDAELASGIKAYASGVKKGFTVDVKFDKPLDKKSAEDTANYVLFGGPRTKLALLQEDEKTVRVIFAAAVVPDQTTILMRNIKDTLGNFMPPVSDFPIVSSDKVLPKLLRVQSTAVSGPFNDTISVMFNEELVADDGKALGNFKVESPIGKAIDLAGSGVSYNAAVSTTTITLAQRDDKALNLRPGDSIKVTVSNVRDIAGNKIVKESVITGSVRGDTTKPQLVSVTQNTAVDETGATVDVQFDEAVDVASAKQLALYAFSGGQKALQAVVKSPETPVDQELLDALATLSDERSRAGLARFESFESRIPGYPGNRKAYDHIVSEFKRLGYKPVTETFRVPVPVQRGENKLTLLGESGQPEATMPLYCLWPNKVQTSTLPKDGLTGHLVYGGKGEFIDFTGQEIMGSIVLLDFDSADNYVNARMLGAQAIIFFDNGGITMGQAYDKFMEVPADVPRFWINKSEAQRLLPLAKKNRRVTLNARMDWVDAETWNVYALLEGSDEKMPVPGDKPKRWKDNIIVVSAYYDSMSVVPSLAPGADSASGITALLEVARVLKHEYPPKASFVFLATSGHFEGLRGMSDFVYRHARKSKYYLARMAVKDKIEVLFSSDKLGAIKDPGELEKAYEAEKRDFRLLVALDLSTHNDQVAAFAEGTYQNWWWGTDNYKQNAIAPFAKKFLEYQDNDEAAFPVEPDMAAKKKSKHVDYLESRKYLNAVTPSKRSWRHYMHTPLGLDHEVVTFVGHFGMGMATAHDTRVWMDTPLDTVANANVTNLTTQIRTLAALFAKAGRDEKFFPDSKLEMKDRGHNLKGNIVWFDRKVNHFVPKASIGGALVTYQLSAERSRSAVRTLMTSMTCEDDPHAGDEQKGFRVTPITSDAKRIHVAVWNRALKDVTEHKVVVETRYGTFAYPLRLEDVKEGRWVADINMAREIYGPDSFIPCSLACGIPLILLLALLFGVSQMPKALRYILWILVTIDVVVWAFWFVFVLAIQVDNRIGEKKEDLNLSWEHGIVKEIVLRSQQGESRHENIDVSFGNFKGQFKHRIRRHPWGLWAMAYKLDDEGRIVFAADRGQEGEKTYPILSPYGWWETDMLQVLFPCRALSVFDTVDSRYLSALDYASILGENDATPIWWGTDQVQFQSQREGKTTEVAVFYARPGTRVKILMSTSLIGVKYLLTNSPDRYLDKPIDKSEVTERVKAESRGKGYPIETGVIFCPSYVGTKDMWVVDDVRMKELAKYGVENKRIEGLHDRARAALEDAKAHWDARRYDKFMAAAREAWGLEARGYPDVKSTANDTVKGIVFYFILLLPFSFFVERLVFGFADIRKRLIAFFLVFFLVFLVLHFVHPAFKLSSSPYIIFLAFVIFALSGIVLFMVLSKFNEEVQKIKRAAAGIHEVDVGRLSATFAAVTLGISNLRKRKVRTSLTAITLILLTFTVLSFTSVTTSLKYYKLPRENKPPYQGVLVRDRNWKGLQTSVLRYLQSAFKDKATLVPRSWFMARMREERQYLAFTCPANGKISYANAFLGMTPQESIASHLDQYLIGEKSRWLQPGDLKVCILPNDMAALIDLTADDLGTEKAKIRMLGSDFEVIGILDSERFNRARCLDDEKLTPVDTVVEGQRMSAGIREDPDLQASEPLESFVHLESTNVMILPHEYLMDIGGTLRSVAITGFKTPKFTKEIENFMSRVALTVFVGEGDQVTVYSSIGSTALGGLGHLFIPILIAALIVLNTMMGSVYERFREIGIYSSVGLAPSHIASLFLAESSVFATVGAVMGYLVGQVLNLQLSNLELLKGVNLNYSSLSAISSTLVVMATVFLSTLYPAKKAAGMAVPDVTRKWKFPEPKGDQWIFDFPFTVAGAEIVGMYAYLARVFESYGEGSTGGFVAEGVKLASQRDNGLIRYIITMKTWLAPYDLGISQDVRLDAIPTGEHNVYRIEVNLQRVSGDVASWRRINRGFLNVLRKRFLVWRTIPPGEKLNYRTTGMTQFSLTAA